MYWLKDICLYSTYPLGLMFQKESDEVSMWIATLVHVELFSHLCNMGKPMKNLSVYSILKNIVVLPLQKNT